MNGQPFLILIISCTANSNHDISVHFRYTVWQNFPVGKLCSFHNFSLNHELFQWIMLLLIGNMSTSMLPWIAPFSTLNTNFLPLKTFAVYIKIMLQLVCTKYSSTFGASSLLRAFSIKIWWWYIYYFVFNAMQCEKRYLNISNALLYLLWNLCIDRATIHLAFTPSWNTKGLSTF